MNKEFKPIYLKEFIKIKPKNVVELLKTLFSNFYGYVVLGQTTYSDRDCRIHQCGRYKYRSFDDIMRIVLTYFPGTSPKEVFLILLKLNIKNTNNEICNLQMNFCETMRKIKMYYSPMDYDKNKLSHKCMKIRYNSKFSWIDLLNIVGINSVDELVKLSKNKV